jgi:hypothetical protein
LLNMTIVLARENSSHFLQDGADGAAMPDSRHMHAGAAIMLGAAASRAR